MDTYKTISETLQTYLQTYDKNRALNQILSLITRLCPGSVPYILTVLKTDKMLTHLASSKKIDLDYRSLLQEVPIDKDGSACGCAAFHKKRIIIANPIKDKAYSRIKSLLKKINLQECWAFPIINQKKHLVGTLSLYFTNNQKENNILIKELECILPFIAIIIDHDTKEQETKKQNTLFDDIERFSKSYTWEYNLETKEVWWSKNSYNLLKLDPQKNLPSYETFYNLLTEQSQKEMVAAIESMLKTKQKKSLELTFKHLPDQIFYEEKNIICNKQGDPVKLIGIVRDATEKIVVEKEKARLDEKLQESQERRQALFKKIIVTQEDERKRLARDVHDELGQQLAYLKIKLELARSETVKGLDEISDNKIKMCGSSSCSNSLKELNESIEQLQKTMQTTREIAKELRPPQLDLLELKDLIESHINQLNYPNIKITSKIKINENEISTAIKETIYNISKEGLANAIKHANPKNIDIVLKAEKKQIILAVIDDGLGFKHDDIIKPGSFGLIGIEEQLLPLNGTFTMKYYKQKTILESRIPI